MSTNRRGRAVSALAGLLIATTGLPALYNDAAEAAVVYRSTLSDTGQFQLQNPHDAAVSKDGDIYVVDPALHRVTKFDSDGNPVLKFGTYGQGDGQLYSPHAIAVGEQAGTGRTLVYVLDTFNNRVQVFDDQGRFIRKFGQYGSDPGQLNAPHGIALIPDTPSSDVFVVDDRNNRVTRFSWNGLYEAVYTCPDCPGGRFSGPTGIAVRNLPTTILLYVVDTYAGVVRVLRGHDGSLFRTYASQGSGPGQLTLPDEIDVDKDGYFYVADPAFGVERISKFGPNGGFLYSFSRGPASFTSPHGVTVDQDGIIYVVDTGGSAVYTFAEEPDKLTAAPTFPRSRWLADKKAWFSVKYNGVEQTCVADGSARLVAHPRPSQNRVFNLSSDDAVVGRKDMAMPMTDQQTTWVRQTWAGGRRIDIDMSFRALCRDGTRLTDVRRVTR
jgi:sugar lactone lactonase YvrE